ncbi:MAG: ribonuclease H [Prevotella sp.]|nr:ribonuclease H [Prevotella sp.]MBQ3741753.1 ribonuclease H [Prevotella sp.]
MNYELPTNPPDYRNDTVLPLHPEVKANAWAVDAACSGNPGPMEYQCIDLATGAQVFHYGPLHGTNNIGEFLAIVHALALLEQRGLKDKTIYSDSYNAILWVKKKKCKTTLPVNPKTEKLHDIIRRAEQWLRTHAVNTPVEKWETAKWGEIPADFGRKK